MWLRFNREVQPMSLIKLLIASLTAWVSLVSAPLYASTHNWVYRVDHRPPDQIFSQGFTISGANNDLLDHVLGDSCPGAPPERAMWLSGYSAESITTQHAQSSLVVQSIPPGQGLWVYAIRTDHTYLEVADALRQVREEARQQHNGYNRGHIAEAEYLLNLPQIRLRGEVVTPRRISPQSIQRAEFYSLAPSSTPANPVMIAGPGFTNAGYRQPQTQMTNRGFDLRQILSPASVTLYGEQLANDPDLCALCLEVVGASSSRIRRDALRERLSCPSAAHAFIGSED